MFRALVGDRKSGVTGRRLTETSPRSLRSSIPAFRVSSNDRLQGGGEAERPVEGWSVVVGQASEGVAVDRVLVPFADNNDLDQFGADVAVDQPEAFGPVVWQVELDSEETTEVPRDVAFPERFAAPAAELNIGGRGEGGTSNIRALFGGKRHHIIARRRGPTQPVMRLRLGPAWAHPALG